MGSISGIGGASGMAASLYGMQGAKRQNPTDMANQLFSKIDTAGKGSIEKTDLQAALAKASSGSTAVSATSNVDELFSAFDTDGSGKVTKQEFTDSLQKLSDQLEQQQQSRRIQDAVAQAGLGGAQGAGGGMPPPPPPSAGDEAGMSKEQMSSKLSEVGSSDSQLSSLLSNTLKNFEAADANQDGKVSAQEALAYQKANEGSAAAAQTQTQNEQATGSTSTESANTTPAQMMRQVAQLFQAYMGSQIAAASGSISVSA